MTIASHADALILVAEVDRVRRETLVETRRVLERCPTFTLGVIATRCKATERGNYRQRFSSAMARTRNGPVGEASGELLAEILRFGPLNRICARATPDEVREALRPDLRFGPLDRICARATPDEVAPSPICGRPRIQTERRFT